MAWGLGTQFGNVSGITSDGWSSDGCKNSTSAGESLSFWFLVYYNINTVLTL